MTVDGVEYDTLVMSNHTPVGDMTIWQTPAGDIIKVNAMMEMSMVRKSRADAMATVENNSSSDLAVLTSVKPDKQILQPRRVSKLDIVVRGLSSDMVINDPLQASSKVQDSPSAVRYTIKSSAFDPKKTITLPVDSADVASYVAASPHIDSDSASIKEQSIAIVSDEKSAYKACSRIRQWVYANMRPKADIGISRSASDVLQSKVGVCRDYATLFAGLARSAGIPTRIAYGLIYNEGRFYYHAWCECYLGGVGSVRCHSADRFCRCYTRETWSGGHNLHVCGCQGYRRTCD